LQPLYIHDDVSKDLMSAFDGATRALATHLRAELERRGRVGGTAEAHPSWRQTLELCIVAALGWLAADPERARLCVLAPLSAGPAARGRQQEAVGRLTALLWREIERSEAGAGGGGGQRLELACELYVGAAREAVFELLSTDRAGELQELAPRLRGMAWLIELQLPV
jgi:hypothetical protein